KSVRVLLAEDNKINQMLVEKVLRDKVCTLQITETGQQALDFLVSEQFDVILMDLQMPELDGYAAIRKIRQDFTPPTCYIPIIALTAHASQKEIDKCLAVGANAYLSKPFKSEHLLKGLDK